MRYISNTLAAALAIVLLGQAEAGLIARVPRTETPCSHSIDEVAPTETPSILSRHIFAYPKPTGLPLGGIFVEPDPSDRPNTTTSTFTPSPSLSPVFSNTTTTTTTKTSLIPEETPCEDHHTVSANTTAHNNATTARIPPKITSTPTPTVDLNLEQKFVQTTYWACATLGTEAHCGWHEPILDASSGAYSFKIGRGGIGRDSVVLRAGGIALLVVGAFMLV